jgi:hypothetical protein
MGVAPIGAVLPTWSLEQNVWRGPWNKFGYTLFFDVEKHGVHVRTDDA